MRIVPGFPAWAYVEEGTLDSAVRENCDAIRRTLRAHGAVVLRGDTSASAPRFAAATAALGLPVHEDLSCSAGPRVEVAAGVFTANEAPAHVSIPVHHEMAQCAHPPGVVAFFCETPPTAGGATPLVRSETVARYLEAAHPEAAARMRLEGMCYARGYPPRTDAGSALGKSWREAFGVVEGGRAEVERVLEADTSVREWEWRADDSLRVVGTPVSVFRGRQFFAAAESSLQQDAVAVPEAPSKALLHADGSSLDAHTRTALRAAGRYADSVATRFQWKRGDLLFVDNATVMHARDAFAPPRRILVALLGDVTATQGA